MPYARQVPTVGLAQRSSSEPPVTSYTVPAPACAARSSQTRNAPVFPLRATMSPRIGSGRAIEPASRGAQSRSPATPSPSRYVFGRLAQQDGMCSQQREDDTARSRVPSGTSRERSQIIAPASPRKPARSDSDVERLRIIVRYETAAGITAEIRHPGDRVEPRSDRLREKDEIGPVGDAPRGVLSQERAEGLRGVRGTRELPVDRGPVVSVRPAV